MHVVCTFNKIPVENPMNIVLVTHDNKKKGLLVALREPALRF